MSNKDFQNGFIAGWASRPGNAQSDLNENDPTSISYVKNRTHYTEEVEIEYTTIPNVTPDSTIGYVSYGRTIGLEIGKEYICDVCLIDGTTQTTSIVVGELPESVLGVTGIPYVNNSSGEYIDGVIYDYTTGVPSTGDGFYYKITNKYIEKIVIHGLPHTETVVHKIPHEYLTSPDWDESDESSGAHIKNRTHYDSYGFVKDFVVPENLNIDMVLDDNAVLTAGYTLYGQKLKFTVGRVYNLRLELILTETGEISEQADIEVTAYPANQVISELGDDWQDVIILADGSDPYVISGAMATDFSDLSTYMKVEDTFGVAYNSKTEDLRIKVILQDYNENAHTLKPLDMKYLPMHKIINKLIPIFEGAPDDSITTAKLKDQSVTTPKIADNSIKGYKLEQPKTLFRLSVPADVQYIIQDLSVECKKVRIKGYLYVKTIQNSFSMSFGDSSWSKTITFTDVPISENLEVRFEVFMSSMDSVKATTINGRELEIEYSIGYGASSKKYIKTFFDGYAFEQIRINIDTTVRSGSIQIDSVLSLEE